MEVSESFLIPGRVEAESGLGGLPRIKITSGQAVCRIYLMGAHIASFLPDGVSDLLWMSPYSDYSLGTPMRGGIPLCFPWFGAHRNRSDLPLHGFVRTIEWKVLSSGIIDGESTQVVFSLKDTEETRTIWPYSFQLEFEVTVSSTLTLQLKVDNKDKKPFSFEEAFHTYFSVSHPENCFVKGLSNLEYIDRLRADARGRSAGDLPVSGPLVQAFMNTPGKCELIDLGRAKRIQVLQKEMGGLVVWNPGKTMGEPNPEIQEGWKDFVCLESANCLDHEITLPSGKNHTSRVTLSIQNNNIKR